MTTELSVETESLPGSQLGITIEVPQATVDETFERVLSRLSRRVRIEGFRPGKAPRALVEARLGSAAIREEVIEDLVPQVVNQVLRDGSISAIDRPRVDVVELERGRPARLTARVSVMPEVKLPELSAVSVRRPATEVTDEMVERRLRELRERLAEVEPVEREVRTGDLVIADLSVSVEGAVIESESRSAMEFEVREGVLIPELLAVLPGARQGETVEAEVVMPEEHSNPDLAGKAARVGLVVRGVKEKRVPELDDEVAKRLSDGERETVDALREAVRGDLVEQARRLDDLSHEQAVLRSLVEASEVEVPESLVEQEVGRQLEDLQRRLQAQGLRLDRYLQYLQKTPEQYVEELRPDAESRLKVDLVLEELGRREGIEPEEEDVLAHMRQEAEKDPEMASRLDELTASQSARAHFRHRLQRIRILERLVERAGGQPEAGVEEGVQERARDGLEGIETGAVEA